MVAPPAGASPCPPGGRERLHKVYLAEYDKLKAEQTQRITVRDNLVYATLVAAAAVLHYTFDPTQGTPLALLALPLACFVLGLLHTVNDDKSRQIACYLRTRLRHRVSTLTGDEDPCVFGWEWEVRSCPGRSRRKKIQLASAHLIFVVPGFAALLAYFLLESWPYWWLATSTAIVEAILLLLLSWEIIRGRDISS